ncbi:STAS domain-containing protein [Streptomyces sp. NPDC007070]|uniref:STAS domain-containing protein n=1 Tax=Streptomyces sp. NPDC007070 TaxID=3154312 RepID=UPI003411A89C
MGIPNRTGTFARGSAPDGAAPGLRVSPLPRRAGLRAAGEVSLVTRAIWQRALDRAVSAGEDVYRLELSAVTFVDVAGVDVLADAARRLAPGRRIVLARPPAAVPRMLELFWPGLTGIEVSPS